MNLEKHETHLRGSWNFDGKRTIADDVCKRIEWLTTHNLNKVATDESGWSVLYQDPNDQRYWELIYPNSGQHGGGPPSLISLTFVDAKDKYDL